eukprot:gene31607-39046_t
MGRFLGEIGYTETNNPGHPGEKYTGTTVLDDGVVFTGVWVSANINSWVEYRRFGPGTERYTNGDLRQCEYFEGMRHGPAVLTRADGTTESSLWAWGEETEIVTKIVGTETYEGGFKGGKRHGLGK